MVVVLAAQVGAQQEQVLEDKGVRQQAGSKAPETIKSATTTNRAGAAEIPAPPEKSGEKARGQAVGCRIVFDNNTAWWTNAYVNGYAYGQMGPWGTLTAYLGDGPSSLYAQADFDNGARVTWGPQHITCSGGFKMTWRLRPPSR